MYFAAYSIVAIDAVFMYSTASPSVHLPPSHGLTYSACGRRMFAGTRSAAVSLGAAPLPCVSVQNAGMFLNTGS